MQRPVEAGVDTGRLLGDRDDAWAIRELTYYLEAVTTYHDQGAAIADSLELVIGVLQATSGAMVTSEGVRVSLGFGRGLPKPDGQLVEQLRAVVARTSNSIVVPGAGRCEAFAVDLRSEQGYSMVVARRGEPFSEKEHLLALCIGRALSLILGQIALLDDHSAALEAERRQRLLSERQAAENERLLTMVEERQALLEKLARIQRSISTHTPLPEIYGAIVQGARDLLDVQVIGLRHIDLENPDEVIMVASQGMSDATLRVVGRQPVGTGLGGRAIVESRLVVVPDYSVDSGGLDVFVAEGVQTAMSAPIHVGGHVVGSLTVGSTQAMRHYSEAEQEILLAFAEHASLALTDARTLAAMHDAMHDPLTGLPSRSLFFDRLEHSFTSEGRTGLSTGVLFIDLDRFKSINDRFGHAGGDRLLAETASRLRGCLRESDTAARLGGDEFTVLVEQVVEIETMIATAERIARVMTEPFLLFGTEVAVTVSIGVALSSPELSNGEVLLRQADLAMYGAKNRGGDSVAVFEPSMAGRGQLS